MSSRQAGLLAPYAALAFVVGFGWFILAPLVPAIMVQYRVPLSAALLLVSLFGYTMIIGALPAGFWSAKKGPHPVLHMAIFLTVLGLLVRVVASTYSEFLVGQFIAALAYPFLIAPIGSVLRLCGVVRTKMATGMVIGSLFLGMAVASVIAPSMALHADLWVSTILAVVVGVWLWVAVGTVPPATLHRMGPVRLVISAWWWVGFVVASLSVMYGAISSAALLNLHMPNALAIGGYLSSLTFLGSALGAIFFGWMGQSRENSIGLQRVLGLLSFVFLLGCALELTGTFPPNISGLDLAFLGFGLTGNGWYTLALDAAARQAQSAGSAGLATAGFSMASNIGVAVVPVVLGPLVIKAPGLGVVIIAIMAILAVLVPFVMKTEGSGEAPGDVAS